jgi:hypothetical protein
MASVVDQPRQLIRFNIDGTWNPDEMGMFLIDLDDLYMLHMALRSIRVRLPGGGWGRQYNLRRVSEFMKGANRYRRREFLELIRIQYGSPGITDLAGLGEIVGHLKEFVPKVIENVSNKEERDLRNIQRAMEIAREYLQLQKEYNLTQEDLHHLIEQIMQRQQRITRLVRQGKLVSVEIITQQLPS